MKAGQQKTLFRPVSKADVVAEYTGASLSPVAFEKAKWGSAESMLNRFRLGLSFLEGGAVGRWLDIGCGLGLFFSVAEDAGCVFDEVVGVDITPAILKQARQRKYTSPARFFVADLESLPQQIGSFDFVSLVGVLQQCGICPDVALSACVEVLKPGGRLFLTTKNIGWEVFTSGTLTPEPGHSWFDFGEIAQILVGLQVEIVAAGGFLPKDGTVVPLAKSHTFYILGRKRA